jgi:hypothetical protein
MTDLLHEYYENDSIVFLGTLRMTTLRGCKELNTLPEDSKDYSNLA